MNGTISTTLPLVHTKGPLIPTIMADEHMFRRSLLELQQYLEPRPTAVVIPGHDPAAWAELAEVYS